jgi:hypothetical protein
MGVKKWTMDEEMRELVSFVRIFMWVRKVPTRVVKRRGSIPVVVVWRISRRPMNYCAMADGSFL